MKLVEEGHRAVGTCSRSWIRPPKVRLLTMSRGDVGVLVVDPVPTVAADGFALPADVTSDEPLRRVNRRAQGVDLRQRLPRPLRWLGALALRGHARKVALESGRRTDDQLMSWGTAEVGISVRYATGVRKPAAQRAL